VSKNYLYLGLVVNLLIKVSLKLAVQDVFNIYGKGLRIILIDIIIVVITINNNE
jgi:hypothetical protein